MCPIEFDLRQGSDIAKLGEYCKFRKVKGLLHAFQLGLPVPREGFLYVDTSDAIRLVGSREGYSVVLCRPDSPIEDSFRLPRGRDIAIDEIPLFLVMIRKKCPTAIVIGFKHPSIAISGSYVPRYQTEGAVSVYWEKTVGITVEHVGPGFDVGDLTRGKTVHSRLWIPWNERYGRAKDWLRYSEHVHRTSWHISEVEYAIARNSRIQELTRELGEIRLKDIQSSIPTTSLRCGLPTLKRIQLEIIENILYSSVEDRDLAESTRFLVMANIYKAGTSVLELWLPDQCAI